MTNKLNIVWIETETIKPYQRNARHNDETVQKLVEIIPKVGFNQPIVVDKNNVIVKGHSRWKAAVRLGMEKVPCVISENDDETNKLDRLADNKIQEFSKWNDELLVTELASLNIEDLDISDFGFDYDFSAFNAPTKSNATEFSAPSVEYPSDDETAYPTHTPPAYTPPSPTENFITEKDIARTVPNNVSEYGVVTCPKCGTTVRYKK